MIPVLYVLCVIQKSIIRYRRWTGRLRRLFRFEEEMPRRYSSLRASEPSDFSEHFLVFVRNRGLRTSVDSFPPGFFSEAESLSEPFSGRFRHYYVFWDYFLAASGAWLVLASGISSDCACYRTDPPVRCLCPTGPCFHSFLRCACNGRNCCIYRGSGTAD